MMHSSPQDMPLNDRVVDFPTAPDQELEQASITIAVAAKALGVSESTLRRKLTAATKGQDTTVVTGEVGSQRYSAQKVRKGRRTHWAVYILGPSGQSRSEDVVRGLRSVIGGHESEPLVRRRWWQFFRRSA